ncbi:MAG: hypothetical protein HYV60_02235 [Planctomycetia bacterium]|nr:hypothetical protein [Planctomycetia bacterium]
MSFADEIDVFYGRVTHNSAQIYVRVSSLAGGDDWTITGKLRGPIAPGTRTLPTTVALKDLGEGATLLASCSIPDPTFWTTQLPGTYELDIQLRCRGEVVETVARSLGIRFFGASGRNFLWEGKRWVLRGVTRAGSNVEQIDAFRDNAGVLVVSDPAEALLRTASEAGILLAVDLGCCARVSDPAHGSCARVSDPAHVSDRRSPRLADPVRASGDLRSNVSARSGDLRRADSARSGDLRRADGDLVPKLRSLTRWPGVAIVILPTDCVVDDELRAAAPNLLFAQRIDGTAPKPLADWAQVAFCDATEVEMTESWEVPIVAERRLNGDYALIEARRECDHLQRDLAPLGDFAGYVVHCPQLRLAE